MLLLEALLNENIWEFNQSIHQIRMSQKKTQRNSNICTQHSRQPGTDEYAPAFTMGFLSGKRNIRSAMMCDATASCSSKCHQLRIWKEHQTTTPTTMSAKTPPLRGSGADASTASSSSMVYVVGLPAPAFPALGPQVGWPDTNIGPTWPTCPTRLVPKIIPVLDIPLWVFVRRITRYPASHCLKCLLCAPFLLSNKSQARANRTMTTEMLVARIKPNMGLNDWQFNYADVAPHSMKRTCLSCPIICIQFHIKLIPAWVGWHRNQKYSFQCDTIPSKKISLRRPPANRIA